MQRHGPVVGNGVHYIFHAAVERRLRAAKLAGLDAVPCLSIHTDSQSSSLLALVENLQRRDLDFWEEALALRRLIDAYHISQEEVARRIGKSQSAVANKLRLLKLPGARTVAYEYALSVAEPTDKQAAFIADVERRRLAGEFDDQWEAEDAAATGDDS